MQWHHVLGNIGTQGHLDMGYLARYGNSRGDTLDTIGTRVIVNKHRHTMGYFVNK